MDYLDPELNELLMNYFNSRRIDNFEIKDIQLNIFGKALKSNN
jgi:hypothetical protein